MPPERLVKSVACGREHCIAVTYDGSAYAWGKGDKAWLHVLLHVLKPREHTVGQARTRIYVYDVCWSDLEGYFSQLQGVYEVIWPDFLSK